MSKRQHDGALLPGYDGPFFPEELEILVRTKETSQVSRGIDLENVGKQIGGFLFADRPRTLDGYGWFWGLYFSGGFSGRIAVLFPWAMDLKKIDGTNLDRSPALYTKGGVRKERMVEVLRELTQAILDYVPLKKN